MNNDRRICSCLFTKGSGVTHYICPMHKGLPSSALSSKVNTGIIIPTGDDYALSNIDTAHIILKSPVKHANNRGLKHYWLYALKLEKNKFYVGMTAQKNPYNRIRNHGNFMGARWTMKHSPTGVIELRDIGFMTKKQAERLEHILTKAYIKKYGHRNVRGGKLTYSGSYFKFGPFFMRESVLFEAIVAATLFLLAFYAIAHE